MSNTNKPGGIDGLLKSADPGNLVDEAELASSRARSLLVMDAATQASGTTITRLPQHTSFRGGPPRLRRRLVLASAAAALLVGGIVTADVVKPNGPGATASAAEVLHNAAEAAIRTSDPVVGPGQYLKIETTAVNAMGVLLGEGPVETRRTAEWLDKYSDQVYIPADRSGEWIWNRGARIPTTFFSDEDRTEAAKYQQSQLGEPGRTGELLRAPGGNFYGEQRLLFAGLPLEEGIRTLPRDPQALLEAIRRHDNPDRTEAETLEYIAAALQTGVVPADLRSALYRAAALLPGVTVVDTQANLDGRVGTAIGIVHPSGETRRDIIVDPDTGLLIGERTVMLSDGGTFPAGTAVTWTSVSTSVVDAAP